jgi:hypothetical protein
MNNIYKTLKMLAICCTLICLNGCGETNTVDNPESKSYTFEEILWPSADGTSVNSDSKVLIDYSNISQGYFMAKTLTSDHSRIKIMVLNGDGKYTYDLNKDDEYETYPLNMGDGTYTVKVYENISGDQYALLFDTTFDVTLEDEFLPYLYPNQVVDYNSETLCLQKSFELVKDDKTELERVQDIYTWVLDNVVYDWDKVEEVQGKYVLPVLDEVYTEKKGICFDYAALMSAMLRVQHIPTKVVTGMVDEGYHAWIEVYIENMGWIKPHVYFNSGEWTTMDPTYAAQGQEYDGDYDIIYTY